MSVVCLFMCAREDLGLSDVSSEDFFMFKDTLPCFCVVDICEGNVFGCISQLGILNSFIIFSLNQSDCKQNQSKHE